MFIELGLGMRLVGPQWVGPDSTNILVDITSDSTRVKRDVGRSYCTLPSRIAGKYIQLPCGRNTYVSKSRSQFQNKVVGRRLILPVQPPGCRARKCREQTTTRLYTLPDARLDVFDAFLQKAKVQPGSKGNASEVQT